MYLNHHYTQYTALTMMKKKEVQELFQTILPLEAVKYPCLMHGLLALSALHVAHRFPADKRVWFPIAFRHQGRALAGLRSSLPNIDEHSCHALFALACMVFTISVSLSSGADILHPNESVPTEDLIEPLMLVLGIQRVADAGMHWVWKGIMAPTLGDYELPKSAAVVVPDLIETQLVLISDMIKAETKDPTHEGSLLAALDGLKSTYKDVLYARGSEGPEYLNPGYVWKWSNRVDTVYVGLLKESNPAALVIYAHFALVSDLLRYEWYLEGWAKRVVVGVSRVVDSRWKKVLEWPEQQLVEGLSRFRLESKEE
jgi:hypothetical protein